MPQKPGHLVGPMVWLVPRNRPQAGTLKLGSILTDPYNHESVLATHEVPADSILDAPPSVSVAITAKLSKDTSADVTVSAPLALAPVFSLGAGLGGKLKRDNTTTLNATDVKAKYFLPDEAYCRSMFEKDEIIQNIRLKLFPQLFIIIGVASASQVAVSEKTVRGHGVTVELSGSVPIAGIDEGVSLSHDRAGSSSIASSATSVDFAYRVRQVRYYRVLGVVKQKDVTIGTLMDGQAAYDSDSDEDLDHLKTDLPKFSYLGTLDINPRVIDNCDDKNIETWVRIDISDSSETKEQED